ncbi:MAG TPA: translation initiation factor IF-3 [Chloroflexota bacterium]|nr:translation initiation factor IF-3 [Chloroflexota bacterium]
MPRQLINEAITAGEVVLIDQDGADRGIMSRAEALSLARAQGCDLVQDGTFSSPPTCRLLVRGAAARASRVAADAPPKEIRISTAMGAHDLETRRRQAADLLARGHRVKLSSRLQPSERSNQTAARALLESTARQLSDSASVERNVFNEKGALSILLAPRTI